MISYGSTRGVSGSLEITVQASQERVYETPTGEGTGQLFTQLAPDLSQIVPAHTFRCGHAASILLSHQAPSAEVAREYRCLGLVLQIDQHAS